jgi:hypothetical protein
MSEPRRIERDHPVTPRREIHQAAGFEILDHAAIAVQQHERRAFAALGIVETNANPRRGIGRKAVSAVPPASRVSG